MKVLVCCAAGRVRSTTLAWCLKRRFPAIETLACGIASTTDGNSPETIAMLLHWADKIIVVQAAFLEKIPAYYLKKTIVMEVGPDVWGRPWDPQLVARCEALISNFPLIDEFEA